MSKVISWAITLNLYSRNKGVLLSTLHVKNNPYLNAGISESSLFVSCNRVALIQVNTPDFLIKLIKFWKLPFSENKWIKLPYPNSNHELCLCDLSEVDDQTVTCQWLSWFLAQIFCPEWGRWLPHVSGLWFSKEGWPRTMYVVHTSPLDGRISKYWNLLCAG